MNNQYIAYYRVSTKRQIESGLGLEAQQMAVKQFIKIHGGSIIAEYTEKEKSSGKNDKREEMAKAISKAKEEGATLLIAKLDRLSRKVSFVANLRDSRIKFICCDNPNATQLTIDILAAVAEDEARRISERVKAALEAKKVRLIKEGKPTNWRKSQWSEEARSLSVTTNKTKAANNRNTSRAKPYAIILRAQGLSLSEISNKLNHEGHKTPTGKAFTKQLVKYLIEKP